MNGRFLALVLIVAAIGLLHYFTPGHLHFYHDTFRRLSYFPIVLGALWFGMRGGLILAGLSSLAFIPHLFHFFGQGLETYLGELTEITLYLATGLVVGVIADREHRLREQYRRLSEKLEKSHRRLQRETGQLLAAEKQLAAAQRLSALGRLSASLAHEIKNPLSSIRGTAEIFLDEFPPGHPRREFVEILLKETSRLNATVDKVLGYSRGQRADNPEPGSTGEPTTYADPAEPLEPLDRLLTRIAALAANPMGKKNIQYRVHGLEQAADLAVPANPVSQVLLNLLLNAIDAVSPGGEISLAVERRALEVQVTVADNGPGIAEADKEKIFTAFYTAKPEGTGLGLLISRKIVESLGGTITAGDRPGGGALFTLRLPAENFSAVTEPGDDGISDQPGPNRCPT
ncbi:sensor histidine kinase [Desulfurivibrio alkaliphilus]|uniref:histidine kinase n=1 Tax=Desulfurivibrio alkaliphilus (strain DSM 19089 / UNIQEM U267 / AHT2) TaxID=589865 RepID=D6Z0C9_DESAT|nr:ATP-binding protein [Desulfurivibrio alkaliphilus]ADH87162.1 integral membrane sensor signal transduction histidine kinase [Desulfurivibrio alkaliphilus AHT 2]